MQARDYNNYYLSSTSSHIPQPGECEQCPFVNKCKSGERCIQKKTESYERRIEYYKRYRKNQKAKIRKEREVI